MAREKQVLPTDLPNDVQSSSSGNINIAATTSADPAGSRISLEKLEETHIRRVLEQATSLVEAAEVLGLDQATLYRKRKKLGLE